MLNWTAKDLVGLKVPTEVAISPDGTKIAIAVSEPDWGSGVMVSNLWLWRNGELSQWTFGDKSIAQPKFSPDGNWLAFLAKPAKEDEAKNQVWLMSLNGGEPRQLTEAKEGVVTFEWHPDSKLIWCVIPEAKPKERRQAEEVDRKRRADFSYHDDALPQRTLWKFKVPDGKGEKVFVGDAGIYELKVSPNGKRIVFATTFTGKRDDWRRSKLFWLSVDEPKPSPRPICEREGAQTLPQFSPDGAKVAFLSWREPDRSFSHHRIFIADFEGNWRELNSTPDLEIETLHWKHRWLFCLLQTGCTSQIWRVDENEAVPITEGDWVITGFNVLENGKTFAAIRTDDRNLPEVWLGELEGEQIRWWQISDFNPQVKRWKLPRVQIVRWQSNDTEVEGLLWIPPKELHCSTPLPTVVWVHGGPKSRAMKALLSAAGIPSFLASRGYAVLAPNFRGSGGYSNEFATANFRDLGGSDFQDILSGIEWCIAQGIADPERIGIAGGSYGGYMTNWALANSERFKAGVSLYGIALLFSDFGNSNNPSWEPDYLGGFPWEIPELYLQRSPFIHAHKIKAPLLLLHGESDLNTFISNSQEMFTALKKLGRTVEFVRYPREGHGFREPNHQVDVLERISIWFDKWLKGDAFASAVPIGEQASDGNLSARILDRAKISHPVNLELSGNEKLVSVVLSLEAKDNDGLLLSRDVRLLDSNGREYPVAGLLQTEGEICWLVEGDLKIGLAQKAISLNLAFRLPAESQPAAVKVRHLILRV